MHLMRASRREIDFDESLARALNLNGILGCAAENSIRISRAMRYSASAPIRKRIEILGFGTARAQM
jgi:hypothetical protein